MAKFTVNYFEAKWLAEPIRMILSYGGHEFVDNRFKRDDWASIKPTTPCGQAPFLEVDGKKLGQSRAICRYLAKQNGLVPDNDWDAARCDMIVDYSDDFRNPLGQIYFETNEEIKKEKFAKYMEGVPNFLNNFEKFLKENGSNGFLVGDKLTWADIYVSYCITLVQAVVTKMEQSISCDKYPLCKALISKVESLPKIAEWIAKRPQTDF